MQFTFRFPQILVSPGFWGVGSDFIHGKMIHADKEKLLVGHPRST